MPKKAKTAKKTTPKPVTPGKKTATAGARKVAATVTKFHRSIEDTSKRLTEDITTIFEQLHLEDRIFFISRIHETTQPLSQRCSADLDKKLAEKRDARIASLISTEDIAVRVPGGGEPIPSDPADEPPIHHNIPDTDPDRTGDF